MKINTRKVAMEILNDIEKRKSFSNKALLKIFSEVEISTIDRKFISKLVYGVVENKIYLDYIIRKFSSVRLKKIDIAILNLLRLGAYQIIFLSKTPDSAAVNESVNLSKKMSYKHSGFVNGVLRNLARDYKAVELPDRKENAAIYLSVKYSHPEWLVERWMNSFGEEFTEDLLFANNETPNLVLRTNTLLINREDLIKKLNSLTIECEKSDIVEDGIIVTKTGDTSIESLELFKSGHFTVQDESSMMVSLILDPKKNETILDLCSAPGGKATHMAQLMENTGEIVASDISEYKINLVIENMSRLGITNINTCVSDATVINEEFVNKFDKVLVDAPCSGFGIIRRKPDIKFNKTLEDIQSLNDIQYEILKNASQYVKQNGVIIYSTCTIEDSENRGMIKKFLNEFSEFTIESIEGQDDLQLYPNVDGTDGFYCCKLKKK